MINNSKIVKQSGRVLPDGYPEHMDIFMAFTDDPYNITIEFYQEPKFVYITSANDINMISSKCILSAIIDINAPATIAFTAGGDLLYEGEYISCDFDPETCTLNIWIGLDSGFQFDYMDYIIQAMCA